MLEKIYQRRKKSISLTPLIDVVLILLMFFMLTSSFIKEKQVDLRSPSSNLAATDTQIQRLWLTASGDFIGADAEALSETSLRQFDMNKALTIHPEEKATLQTTVNAVEFLKSMGFVSVNLSRVYVSSDSTLGVVPAQTSDKLLERGFGSNRDE